MNYENLAEINIFRAMNFLGFQSCQLYDEKFFLNYNGLNAKLSRERGQIGGEKDRK